MGKKNDVWSSQKVLGLRRTGIQVWTQHVATGAFPSFRYYPQAENLNGWSPISYQMLSQRAAKWPSGMLFDLLENQHDFAKKGVHRRRVPSLALNG